MRRIIIALLVLLLPTTVAIVVYLLSKQEVVQTKRNAVAQVVTIAGAGHPGAEDGPRVSASFANPFGVAIDKRGEVVISDGASNRIRRITPDGNIATITGSAEGYADGPVDLALFNTPSGIAADKDANIYIADTSNNRIRKLSGDRNLVTTIAGAGAAGHKDGAALEAQFDGPIGVAVDKEGNVFVADSYNDRIRKISTNGTVTTIAGAGVPGYADGAALEAQFNIPCGVAVDGEGNIFVADTGNGAIRRITPQGEVTTVIKDEQISSDVQTAPVRLRRPIGIAITRDGFLFVTDEATGQVLRFTPELEASVFAGSRTGFGNGPGLEARFNGPAGVAVDRDGNLFVADANNYLVRMIASVEPGAEASPDSQPGVFIQPATEQINSNTDGVMPRLSAARINASEQFLWPLAPQDQPHEVTGVVGEARGAAGGVALHHLHSGLDIRGNMGEPVLSVMDEKINSPIAAWGYGGAGEGIRIGLMSYIHIRVGRDAKEVILSPEKFKPIVDAEGKPVAMRVRRGARFKVGDIIGTLNSLYHVHLNVGPWNAQANPIELPFVGFKDTVAPVIEPDGIEVANPAGEIFTEKRNGRLVVTGDVDIIVTAYDRVDGNAASRKLGLYRAGYQVLDESGSPVKGFEQPLANIEFNRLPPDDEATRLVYAEGSGVSAYGTPTKFKYIVTNRVRDGVARDGTFRTSAIGPGNYRIRIEAADYRGNRATGKATELAITVE